MNHDLYDLTFGRTDKLTTDKRLSKKFKRLNYKKYMILLSKGGDMVLNNTRVEEQCPTVADILSIPISKFINISAKNCG